MPAKIRKPRAFAKRMLVWDEARVWPIPGKGGYFLRLPPPPSGNAAYRAARGRVISSKEWLEYQAAITMFAKIKRITPIAAPMEIGLTIRWYRQSRSGDLTNREKTIEDALQGICFQNDKQVRRKSSERFDEYEGPSCVEVEVLALSAADPEGSA